MRKEEISLYETSKYRMDSFCGYLIHIEREKERAVR